MENIAPNNKGIARKKLVYPVKPSYKAASSDTEETTTIAMVLITLAMLALTVAVTFKVIIMIVKSLSGVVKTLIDGLPFLQHR